LEAEAMKSSKLQQFSLILSPFISVKLVIEKSRILRMKKLGHHLIKPISSTSDQVEAQKGLGVCLIASNLQTQADPLPPVLLLFLLQKKIGVSTPGQEVIALRLFLIYHKDSDTELQLREHAEGVWSNVRCLSGTIGGPR
jgi:hypothetical protein